jgi:hypothetical protein
MINEMLAIENEIKSHRSSIDELLQKGLNLRSEFESWRTNLPFGLPEIATAKPRKSEGKDDLKVALKLVLKRAAAKAVSDGCAKDVALNMAETAGRKYVEKKGADLPSWVAEWSKQLIEKMYPQSQVEAPVANASENKEIGSVPTEAPKASKKRKK